MPDNNRENLISLIDWLSFTLKTVAHESEHGTIRTAVTVNDVCMLLNIPESEFVDMPRGLHGYHYQKVCGDIRILFGGTGDMGIHVQMSGQGCRQWETYFGDQWDALIEELLNHDAKISRIDLAVDDIRYHDDKPYFKVGDLIKRAKKGLCRSKWRSAQPTEKIKLADGSSHGKTIYYGSPTSKMQLRIYEKNFERVNAGKELEEGLTAWNRIELQLADDRAQTTADFITKGTTTGEIIFGILSHYINYVDDNGDSNKARWPISEFWLDFLNDAAKLRLASKAPDKTIPIKEGWLHNQVSATQAEVWYAMGSPGEEYFVDMMERGLLKMSDAQWKRAEAFREMMEVERAHDIAGRARRYDQYRENRDLAIAEHQKRLAEQHYEHEKRDAGTSQSSDPLK